MHMNDNNNAATFNFVDAAEALDDRNAPRELLESGLAVARREAALARHGGALAHWKCMITAFEAALGGDWDAADEAVGDSMEWPSF